MMLTGPSVTVEVIPIDDVRPDPANRRRISDDELESLTRSLRQFGFVQPVLARREDRVIIGGHQRLVAARRLGLTTVPVTWLDVSVEQARVLGLALNRIRGSWDEQLLARLLADLRAADGVDVSLSGCDEDEVARLLKGLDRRERRERPETFDLETALDAATREPRTKPGELWGSATIAFCAATQATRQTSIGSSAVDGRRWPSPTRPTTSASAITAASNAARAGGGSPTTPLDPTAWEAFCRAWIRNLLGAVDGAIY